MSRPPLARFVLFFALLLAVPALGGFFVSTIGGAALDFWYEIHKGVAAALAR